MFPDDFIETTEATATEAETDNDNGIDFVFDYSTGQHILTNGKFKECSRADTVRQFIQNVTRTKINAYEVYTRDESEAFGLSVHNYIGKKSLPAGYLNSELKREVKEQLLKHPLIEDVYDWTAERGRRKLAISFTVKLTDGTILEEELTTSDKELKLPEGYEAAAPDEILALFGWSSDDEEEE